MDYMEKPVSNQLGDCEECFWEEEGEAEAAPMPVKSVEAEEGRGRPAASPISPMRSVEGRRSRGATDSEGQGVADSPVSLKVFTVAGVIGVFVLVPVNFLGGQLKEIDFSDIPSKSLDFFSISNVKDGSNRLWVHFSAAYLITGVVCYLLYNEFKYISLKRLAHYSASKPQPHQFTILVSGIPTHDGSNISDAVENFFMEYHPSTYLSHVVVLRTDKHRETQVHQGASCVELQSRITQLENNNKELQESLHAMRDFKDMMNK
ncbi:hypothetical protein J5N97_011148 [Dioscorea zingiberensis]|uniref:Uncharacterized protein n=1 Tax=Dioscorea zingiberensis TaxID=325984 RepID=A0A9D5HNB6_9LILI|nr:hypothetical protein J5N97_011148 [Dioscorea zingiberensis]